MRQAPYEVPVDKEGCSVNDRDEKWLKNEIKFAEKLWNQIQSEVSEDDTSFLASLPEPWDFLDNGETWKSQWKGYVERSLNNLDEKYPGQKELYMGYITALELHTHNPGDYDKPVKPVLDKDYKRELKILRAFFDCREMRYMNMLCTIFDIIENEFPHLLE